MGCIHWFVHLNVFRSLDAFLLLLLLCAIFFVCVCAPDISEKALKLSQVKYAAKRKNGCITRIYAFGEMSYAPRTLPHFSALCRDKFVNYKHSTWCSSAQYDRFNCVLCECTHLRVAKHSNGTMAIRHRQRLPKNHFASTTVSIQLIKHCTVRLDAIVFFFHFLLLSRSALRSEFNAQDLTVLLLLLWEMWKTWRIPHFLLALHIQFFLVNVVAAFLSSGNCLLQSKF